MTSATNGSLDGTDVRSVIPQFQFREDHNNVGGTTGISHNGGVPWSAAYNPDNLNAALQDPSAWDTSAAAFASFSGDGWGASWAQTKTSYANAGSHFAQTTPPSGFRAGPFT